MIYASIKGLNLLYSDWSTAMHVLDAGREYEFILSLCCTHSAIHIQTKFCFYTMFMFHYAIVRPSYACTNTETAAAYYSSPEAIGTI